MGGSAISSSSMKNYYDTHAHAMSSKNVHQVFTSRNMPDEFNPAKIKLPREARDSNLSPRSRGVIFAEDLTGSMDEFLMSLIQKEFPRLITETYESVSFDPHIMFMGVGDVEAYDEAPLQVTQFETDIRMLEQLQRIYVEKAGGGNNSESYILPWYFAAKHTSMDCFEKRGEKGFLFTFGDELPTPRLTAEEIERVFEKNSSLGQRFITNSELLEMAEEKFYCYHIILHGWYYNEHPLKVVIEWQKLMGSHVCDLNNHKYLPELIATIFKMYEGMSKFEAISKIKDSNARDCVMNALKYHEENIESSNLTCAEKPDIELF